MNTQLSGTIPHVSVLMAVFNTAPYLQAALESISAQTFRDFEFIVLDDGSSDGSLNILSRYALREPRLRLITRPNKGLIVTRNELLGAARANWVAWMDSDDISLPGRLALQMQAIDADPMLICVGTAAQCIDPQGNYLNIEHHALSHREILTEQSKGEGFRFPTTVMRRETALSIGGFREPFRIGEDLDLLLRIGEAGKMANLAEPLYLYRQHISSICAMLGTRWPVYRDHILSLAEERRRTGADVLQDGGSLTIPALSAAEGKKNEWRVYLSWANHALLNRDFRLAWKYSCSALARQPRSAEPWRMLLRVTRRAMPSLATRGAR